MPISEGTRMLLDEALRQVADEGYSIFGCYLAKDPQNLELVHFAEPNMSRSAITNLVGCWLDILNDQSVRAEVVEPDNKPRLYQA